MHRRWQEWVIVIAIVALGGAGIWTLWGQDLVRIFRPGDAPAPGETQTTTEPAVTPPAGPAAGPF